MVGKGLLITVILTIATGTFGQLGVDNPIHVEPQPPPNTTTPAPTTVPTTQTTTTQTTTISTTQTTTIRTTTTPSTTPTPFTTTSPPTTTTTTPKTTTSSKTTTTIKTTTTPTTPHTSPVTTPSTTVAPTTTVAPPVPGPEIGKWTVHNETANITCIIADMAVQLNVTHKDSQNKTYLILDVPKNATATGTCGPSEQVLNLTWPSSAPNKTNELIVSFTKNDTAKDFSVTFNVTVDLLDGENVTEMKLVNLKPEFTTPYANSYRCIKAQNLNLTAEGSNVTVAYLTISNTQFEAFHNKSDPNFSAAKDCEQSGSPDIVPIAVGCALVGLVAIVLIAYLIGRRRSQARGYLSM